MFQIFSLFILIGFLQLYSVSAQPVYDNWAEDCEKSGISENPLYAESIVYCMRLASDLVMINNSK